MGLVSSFGWILGNPWTPKNKGNLSTLHAGLYVAVCFGTLKLSLSGAVIHRTRTHGRQLRSTAGESMKQGLAILALLSVSGCATYSLDLLPRGPGAMAHGMAKQIDKSVTVNIGDQTFQGRYAYMQGGSYTLATGFAGGQTATATGMGINAVGNGNVLAQSADGHNLRCVFSFSGWSQQGTGVCLTDSGSLYDLQIAR
jgi:hypothetical protein